MPLRGRGGATRGARRASDSTSSEAEPATAPGIAAQVKQSAGKGATTGKAAAAQTGDGKKAGGKKSYKLVGKKADSKKAAGPSNKRGRGH